MSSFIIKVKTEELLSKADTVKTKVDNMQTVIDDTERLLSGTASYWIGDAGDKKRRDFMSRKKDADEVIKRLREYPEDLLKMAGIYDAAEKENIEKPAGLPTDFII